jgi:hypothetical protein
MAHVEVALGNLAMPEEIAAASRYFSSLRESDEDEI